MRKLLGADRCRTARGEQGFTLVEVIVSIVILMIAMSALLTGMVVSLQGVVLARANQQAGDVANGELERIRSFDYPQVTLASADGTRPAGTSYAGETLSVATAGAVQPAVTTVTADNRTYTIRRFVTDNTTDATGKVTVRRVTVEVSFTVNGKAHTRTSSTLVTNTRRGLPLPNFRFDYNGVAPRVSDRWYQTAAPGSTADFGFTLRNLGARDTWNLQASQPGWTFYSDTSKNGVRDTGEPLLTDTDANGVPDTAPIEPSTAPVFIVASRGVGMAESGATNVTFTATSSAQPVGGAKTVETTLNVTTSAATPTPAPTPTGTTSPVPCTGGTPTLLAGAALAPSWTGGGYSTLSLTLQNGAVGDSVSRTPMTLSRDATTQSSTCNFSTELQTSLAGRVLVPLVPAVWSYTPTGAGAKDATYRGTAVLKVWVRCSVVLGTTPTLTASFGPASAATHTATGTYAMAPPDCNGSSFRQIVIPVSNATFDSSGAPVQVRVTSNRFAALLYDAPGAGATLAVGAK